MAAFLGSTSIPAQERSPHARVPDIECENDAQPDPDCVKAARDKAEKAYAAETTRISDQLLGIEDRRDEQLEGATDPAVISQINDRADQALRLSARNHRLNIQRITETYAQEGAECCPTGDQ
ncbi:MAG: hypothetical protein AAFP86_07225 [Planctomycetota bacterium]